MNLNWWRWRPTPMKLVLLALFVAAMVVSVYRLFTGIGAVTGLSDDTPWGLWKVFDVIIYVPLGASGFTMAFVVYFLKGKEYEHIMRRSVIWAAIAYLSVGTRLAFDIGLPWRIANPLIFWGNLHSPLFEVAWCMALYLMVLFFENVPRIMERLQVTWVHKLEHALHWIMPAFVLFGILLSSMHQSTLGTLYMIAGKRLDALWYHPWLNYIYLLTAIAAGLAVTILIEGWSSYYYKTPFQTKLLAKLSVAVGVALAIALAWRVGSMVAEGTIGEIFRPRLATYIWWIEILVGYLLPIAILIRGAWRNSRWPLLIAAGSTVAGMIMLRANVAFTGMAAAMQSTYRPTLPEIIFTLGATAGTLVIFTWFVETLPAILGKEVSVTADAHCD